MSENEPLTVTGEKSALVKIKSLDDDTTLIYQLILIPKNKYDDNYVRPAPYCLVDDKKYTFMRLIIFSQYIFYFKYTSKDVFRLTLVILNRNICTRQCR
jgi:hypothetical protein